MIITLKEPLQPCFYLSEPKYPQKFTIEEDNLSLPYIPREEREDINNGGITLPRLIEYCKQENIDPDQVRIEEIDEQYYTRIEITYKHKEEIHPHVYQNLIKKYEKDLAEYNEILAEYNKELEQYLIDIKDYLIDLSNQEKPKSKNYLCYLLELKDKYNLNYLEIYLENQIIKIND